MSLEIKSWVLNSWDFFSRIIWGLPYYSQVIRSQELKSLVLWKWGQVWDVFYKKDFFLDICILIFNPGVFLFQLPFFLHECKHTLFPCISHSKRNFFSGDFYVNNHTGTRRKWSDFISKDFLFQGFFLRTFLLPKFRTLFFRKFFFKELFWLLPYNVPSLSVYILYDKCQKSSLNIDFGIKS